MEIKKTGFKCKSLDDLLGGGVEHGVITNFYGEPGAGKSNLCLILLKNTVDENRRVIYIDTEGSLSLERLEQITGNKEEYLRNILLFEPENFNIQNEIIANLSKKIDNNIGIIIVDSLVALYRIATNKENYEERNRQLAFQLATLSNLARKFSIPVIVTSQIYVNFIDNSTEIVSRDVAKYWSKCMVKLEKGRKNERIATLTKHRSRPEGISCRFRITDNGIEDIRKLF